MTLVVVAAEIGRSPKVTPKNGGRERWADMYTVSFLGLDPHAESYKQQGRPCALSKGKPIPLKVS